jgi:hypothetical protein
MRRLRVVLWSTALLACGAGNEAPGFDEAHQAAIRDSVGVFLEAFLQFSAVGEWDALLALYADTPEFRWVEDGAVEYESVDAIRAVIASMPQGTRIVTSHDDVRITPLAPGLAWASMKFASMFLEPTGAGYAVTGSSTMVLRNTDDGWRIIGGHSSTARRRDDVP